MKRKPVILAIALLAVITTASAIIFSHAQKRDYIEFKKGDSYAEAWQKVAKFEADGLPKSALELVEQIYKRAKEEKNYAQIAKALMHKMKYTLQTEDGGMVKAINDLRAETDSAAFPLKPLLQSMLGDFFWQYYTQNRYIIYQRTNTGAFRPDDISTWDPKRLIEESVTYYRASVENLDSLQRTRIDLFDDVLEADKNGRKYRPTLFDFLAFRAFDFFTNSEAEITRPSYEFNLNDPSLFCDASLFINHKIECQDTFSLKYRALIIMQSIIAFHLNDESELALVDADLKRLDFIYRNSLVQDKEQLYTDALKRLYEKYNGKTVCPEILCSLGEHYYNLGEKYQPVVNEKYHFKIKEALALAQEGIDKYAGTDGAVNCLALKNKILTKSFGFTIEKSTLPDKPILALVNYKNVDSLYFKIIKIEWLKDWKKTRNLYDSTFVQYYLKKAAVKSFTVSLPDSNDYQDYTTEISLPALPLGNYIIIASYRKDFKWSKNAFGTSFLNVTNLSYLSRRFQEQDIDFIVLNRDNGSPEQGVTATMWKEEYSYIQQEYDYVRGGSYITDINGKFHVGSPSDYRYFFMEFSKGTDHYVSDESFYQYRNYGYDNYKYYRVYFFTDRSIYRPGQTVYFKGIILDTDGKTNKIVPNYSTTITLYDVNYQKVSDLTLTSNEFGSIQGSFVLPTGLLNGNMSLSAGSMGTHYISVEEYKRPKFEVVFDTLKESYRVNDKVIITGLAKAYAGSMVDNATVKYKVTRTTYFPYRWWYWWYYPTTGSETVMGFGETKTDADGKYRIEFEAKPDLGVDAKYFPAFTYTITADITDINGETRSSKTMVNIGYRALVLNSDWTDKVNVGETKSITISSVNLNGDKVDAKGQLSIWKLKTPEKVFISRPWTAPNIAMNETEFRKNFPALPYKNEDSPVSWEKEKLIFTTGFDTKDGRKIDINNLKNWEPGSYYIEIASNDKYGEPVKSENYVTVFNPVSNTICSNDPGYLLKVKNTCEPGEKAQFIVGSANQNVKVLYEVEHKNRIIKSEWITLNKEQKLVELPITEDFRGNVSVHFTQVSSNRVFPLNDLVTVPYTNKQLDITFESFRNKLLPGEDEEWKLKITGKNGDKVAAEMVATLYDASLDAFKPHAWDFSLYPGNYTSLYWNQGQSFTQSYSQFYQSNWNEYSYYTPRNYDKLNMFGLQSYFYTYYYSYGWMGDGIYAGVAEEKSVKKKDGDYDDVSKNAQVTTVSKVSCDQVADRNLRSEPTELAGATGLENTVVNLPPPPPPADLKNIEARSNFAETAFFFPTLQTDANGEIIVSFKVPEALTRWKMLGLAHTKDLKIGNTTNELITQKDLMVTPNLPRFMRENDKITLTAKISNTGENEVSGQAQLFITDALTEKEVDALFGNGNASKPFTVKKGQSANITWEITVPEGMDAVSCKIVAAAGKMSDGELNVVPVLTNRMLVTESLPLPIRGINTKEFKFNKLINSGSSNTLRHQKVTLEFTANPAWYAVQALPYIMEYPYECAEQTFSRYYGNKLASYIANSSPKIKAVFDSWKNTPDSKALLSNLEKNQELKEVLLQETPWVLDAKDETTRKRRVGLLFDLNLMSNNVNSAFRKLEKLQCSNGGFVWFPGMPDDRWITQHIVTGFGHLDHLKVIDFNTDYQAWNMMQRAVRYLDNEMRKDYEWIKKYYKGDELEKDHIWETQIHYLYCRSFYNERLKVSAQNQEAYNYFMGQAKKYWLNKSPYCQGMIALAVFRSGDKVLAPKICASLKENSLNNEEMGMYWKGMGGYYWYQAPIETQALFIEAFDEITANQKDVDDMKVWLLKQKQTQDWKTTKATTEAIYALLLKGTDWLATEPNVEINVGNIKIDPKNMPDQKAEAGTGYIKTSWTGSDIKPEMGNVKVIKKDQGVSWGALYWQYFEQLDKITPHETPLKLNKKLFIERFGAAGTTLEEIKDGTQIKVGDKIIVRIELRVDRKMEYVHMKDMRASGFEPINVISQYKWQDGLGYYESTKDASTNFFFGVLPLGTYVFEYPLRATLTGDFSNGITTIQCMYAPEFTSHSEGIRVKIK